jgi:chorismate mutase/prephenate dehydratase
MSQNSPAAPAADIGQLRESIDKIDRQIVALLDERAHVAKAIGMAKLREGVKLHFDPARQKRVLESVLQAGDGEFPPQSMRAVFVEVMSGCLSREKPPTIGYLGPEGTYSHMASVNEFGSTAQHRPFETVAAIFHAVDRDWIDLGVIPIENSTGGVIHNHLDLFLDYDLMICSEIYLPIHHHLISRNPMEQIKTVYSKVEPFQQCEQWLRTNLPGVQRIEVGATAKAVELASHRDYAAAIGSDIAARMHNVPVLASHIEDMPDNVTRFVVIGKQRPVPTGRDRTSLMVSIEDRPGSLLDLLKPIHARGLNLTKIENRPTRRRAWELVFFIDMDGHRDDPAVAAALEELTHACRSLRIMGSYPRDVKVREDRPRNIPGEA